MIVDYANPRPSAAALAADGVTGVVRYLSPNTSSNPRKRLTAAEVADFRRNGLDLAVVWETTTDRATKGRQAGIDDAHAAETVRASLRIPADTPVYFVAQDQSTITGPQTVAYFEGVASVIGLRRVGGYGGHAVIQYLFDHHLITYGWQTYAWSSVVIDGVRTALWEPRAQLQQYRNGATVAGVTVDLNRAKASDWGQWPANDNTNPSAPVDGVDMPLTQADADLVVNTLMARGLGNDGNPIVAVALDRAAQAFTIDALMKQPLGNSGPVVAVALQSTYQMVTAIQAALNPATLAGIVAQAVEIAGVDVPAETLQTALIGALKELAAAAPPAAV